jgi:hypothetical protein
MTRDGRTGPRRRRFVVLAVLRPALTVTGLVAAYYVLPLGGRLDGSTLLRLLAGLALVLIAIVWQVRAILGARYPVLQGVQALALVIPLFLLVFANVYLLLSLNQPGSFNGPLGRTDALYFVVTVFATVGFGDILPVTELARVLVTVQMTADLLVLGVVLRVILSAVQQRRRDPAGEDEPRAR